MRASGPQAQEAVEHLLTLATRRFDETDEDVAQAGRRRPTGAASVGRCRRRPASRSARCGCSPPGWSPEQDSGPPAEPAAEWRRIVEAVATARREIEQRRVATAREVGAAQASIFDAHLSLLADAEMLADVKARLVVGVGAVAAWTGCLERGGGGVGRDCPTRTCASAPPTSARWRSRCSRR